MAIVTLFNKNYEAQNEAQNLTLVIQKRRERILELIEENKYITSGNLEDILGVSKSTMKEIS
ncbi:hypothetical protein EG856_01680 [Mycoplasmopsis phocirhinis]|uniref:Uncharacterized protein n=1 Tax=Mycoplasmopsis phocirhinis TaxID=142650 RepID=A0A4P6MMB9_9BACT|nr:hypothetical protein [Mycoplasmopsis phocirhinis]QBF34628.1 hypothetical protein EG856_01680 [Mycoplasmopsis phocirhinis]